MEDQALEQLTFKEINHEAALAAACEKVPIGEFFFRVRIGLPAISPRRHGAYHRLTGGFDFYFPYM